MLLIPLMLAHARNFIVFRVLFLFHWQMPEQFAES